MTSGQKIATVAWKRVLALLAIPLVLGGAVLGTYLLAESRDGLPGDPPGECGRGVASGVRASADLEVYNTDRMNVVVSSRLRVILPLDHGFSAPLLAAPSSPERKWAMRCVLGRLLHDSREEEYRTALPTVEVRDGHVVVEDYAYREVVGEPDMWVGVASIHAGEDGQWTLWFQPPAALENAIWTRVSVKTPEGWGNNPTPWPPAARDGTTTRWALHADGQSVMGVTTTMRPDTRATVTGTGAVFPYSVGRAVLYSLISALLAALMYARLRRVPAGGNTPEFLARNDEARRVAFPAAAVSAVMLVTEVAMVTWIGLEDDGFPWGLGAVLKSAVVLALFAFCAIRWRAGIAMTAALTLCATAVLALLLLAEIRGTPLVDDGPVRAAVKTAFVLLTTCVFAGGFVAAVHTVRTAGRSRPNRVAVWLIAAICAVVLVVDAAAAAIVVVARQQWLSPDPLNADNAWRLDWYVGNLAADAARWLTIFLAVVLWSRVRHHLEHTDDVDVTWVKINLGIVFFVVEMRWGVVVWGWYFPVWLVVGALAMKVFLRMGSPLDRLTRPGGPTVRAALAGIDVTELRRRAKDWQLYVQHAKSAELAYASGDIDRETYESKVGGGAPERGWFTGVRRRFGRQQTQPRPAVLLGGLTPIDVLLARGPSTDVAGNIRHATRYALVLGLPVELAIYLYDWPDLFVLWRRPESYLYDTVWPVTAMAVSWYLTGAIIGGLWRHLPGKRGPVKVLPLAVLFVVSRLGMLGVEHVTGVAVSTDELVSCGVFVGVVTIIGLLMDLATLRPLSSAWSRPRQALMAVYGVQNLAGQLTFLLAQVAATLAIVAFLRGGAEPPPYPAVDPFQLVPLRDQ
ncbi:DUF6185 family protein [Actinophytocola sp. KF-1]